jgi:spore maturation protein CgeB
LTDAKENLGELFEVGSEVIAYRDEDELVQAVEHYLAHEDERAAVAAAGQRRTLRDHTFPVRIRELAEILQSYLR